MTAKPTTRSESRSETQSETLWAAVAGATIIDLAHPIDAAMPVSPNHPGFKLALMRRHGDLVRADGGSAANEMMMLGGHTGTHVDALCHVSHLGCLHGGVDAMLAQQGGRFSVHGVETIPITFCRGVMLDLPALHGVTVMPAATPITAADLDAACARQQVTVQPGDAVLIRTGWPVHWGAAETFLGHTDGVPGPDPSGADWLIDRQVRITGAETVAYECIYPGIGHALLPVHKRLLVDAGIHIMEMMNLTELAHAGVSEFLFVMVPLKIVGATGVPIRPVAVIR